MFIFIIKTNVSIGIKYKSAQDVIVIIYNIYLWNISEKVTV